MSGFDDVNQDIATGGGGYAKLQTKGTVVEGILTNVQTRPMVYEGEVVLSKKTKQPRKEWVFTLDTPEGPVKVSAREGVQIATRNALEKTGKAKLEPGAKIRFEVTKDSVRGVSSAEVTVEYIPPKFAALPNDEDAPF